jgi:hypothetical protein
MHIQFPCTKNQLNFVPAGWLIDLNNSEAFLIDQAVTCLCLFALSRGEYALAADTSRYVLKRQGSVADAGIWIMRGLAFLGMGG